MIRKMHKMGRRNFKNNEEENYLVQKFDENVLCEGIPSRILLHLELAHLIVNNKIEVFELL